MIWRERIAAARERGKFTAEDKTIASFRTSTKAGMCGVGETEERYGLAPLAYRRVLPGERSFNGDSQVGCGHSVDFTVAVLADDFTLAESLLDQIEDRALELKREYCQPAG